MADLKVISDGRTALFWFAPDRIKVKPGLNGRDLSTPDNRAHIEAIADNIAANGFMQSKPLEVFTEGEDVYLSDGHCRLAAVQLCLSRGVAIAKVPCVGEPRGTNEVDRILNQDAHNSGKRLTPLELAGNIKRAMALDGTLTVADIAKRMGRSQTYVSQALDFAAAPAEVHAMVKTGQVSATLAAATIRKEGAEKGAAKLKEAVETAKTAGKTKATLKHVAEPKAKAGPTAPAKIVTMAAQDAACVNLVLSIARLDMALLSNDECIDEMDGLIAKARAIFGQLAEAAE